MDRMPKQPPLPAPPPRIISGTIGAGLAALMLFSVLTNLLGLAGVIFIMQVYDRVLPSRSLETLVVLCLIVGSLLVVLGLLTVVRLRLADRIAQRMLHTHEAQAFRSTAERARGAGNRSRGPMPIQDLDTVARAIRGKALNAVLDLPWSAVFIVALASIAPLMGVIASVAAVLLIAVTLAVSWLGSKSATEDAEAVARRWETAFKDLRGPAVVAAHSLSERVASARRSLREADRAARENEHDLRGVSVSFRQIAQISVLAAAAWLVVDGEATIGIMMASGMLIGRAFGPIEAILRERKMVRDGLASLRRLRDARGSAPKPCPLANERLLEGVLRAERLALSPTPNAQRVLSNVDFELSPGSALLITGAGLAGKSLLLRTLAGLHEPSHGTLRLGEVRHDAIGSEAIERLVGYLPQENMFLPGSIADAISRYNDAIPFADIVQAAKRVHLHDHILSLPGEYQTRLSPEGLPLSFSFGRRLALARAICHKPKLLLLDDPVSAFDAVTSTIVAGIVREHCANGGMCVVAASQPILLDIADHVLVLAEGRVVAFGAPAEVFKARPVKAKLSVDVGGPFVRTGSERNT